MPVGMLGCGGFGSVELLGRMFLGFQSCMRWCFEGCFCKAFRDSSGISQYEENAHACVVTFFSSKLNLAKAINSFCSL